MLVVQASISQSSMILLLTSSHPFIYVRNNDASFVDEGAWDIIRNEVIRLSISVNVSDATGSLLYRLSVFGCAANRVCGSEVRTNSSQLPSPISQHALF